MAKASVNKMGLKLPEKVEKFEFQGVEVEVAQFIPTATKISMVSSAVREAVVDGLVNRMILDISLHYSMIENYSNLNITDKMKANILDTFDLFEASGLTEEVLNRIPQEDYEYLFTSATAMADKLDQLLISSVQGFVADDIANQKMAEVLKGTISEETFKELNSLKE